MGILSEKITQDATTSKIVQEGKCGIYKEISKTREPAIALASTQSFRANSIVSRRREEPALSKSFAENDGLNPIYAARQKFELALHGGKFSLDPSS